MATSENHSIRYSLRIELTSNCVLAVLVNHDTIRHLSVAISSLRQYGGLFWFISGLRETYGKNYREYTSWDSKTLSKGKQKQEIQDGVQWKTQRVITYKKWFKTLFLCYQRKRLEQVSIYLRMCTLHPKKAGERISRNVVWKRMNKQKQYIFYCESVHKSLALKLKLPILLYRPTTSDSVVSDVAVEGEPFSQ